MKQVVFVEGMTCQGCVSAVREKWEAHRDIAHTQIDLATGRAELEVRRPWSVGELQSLLPDKYKVSDKGFPGNAEPRKGPSKWVQLRPLWLIFAGILVTSLLLNSRTWMTTSIMLDSMGLFYLVFGFFKFLDYKNFPASFAMYDPLAKAWPFYGWLYPFLELLLAALFLGRIAVPLALALTLVLLGMTTFGVIQVLRSKKTMQCACLGTALKLPMTEATLVENLLMIAMALWMLPAYGYLL